MNANKFLAFATPLSPSEFGVTMLPEVFTTGSVGWKGDRALSRQMVCGEQVDVVCTFVAVVKGSRGIGRGSAKQPAKSPVLDMVEQLNAMVKAYGHDTVAALLDLCRDRTRD